MPRHIVVKHNADNIQQFTVLSREILKKSGKMFFSLTEKQRISIGNDFQQDNRIRRQIQADIGDVPVRRIYLICIQQIIQSQ